MIQRDTIAVHQKRSSPIDPGVTPGLFISGNKEIDALVRQAYGGKIKVFDQGIPRSVRAAETSAEGKSIFAHDPKGKVAEAYRALTKEVLQSAEKRRKHQLDQLR